MKKVAFVISGLDSSKGLEAVAARLHQAGVVQRYYFLNGHNSPIEEYLRRLGVFVKRINFNGKKDLPLAMLKLSVEFLRHRPHVVHTHLLYASLAGLTAAFLAGVRKRIHTRHHSTLHLHFFPSAVKYDKLINRLSTSIVAISKVVEDVLHIEGEPPEKLHLVHHGFELDYFCNRPGQRVDTLKQKYRIEGKSPVIGVISRYTQWKGIQYIIPAFKRLLNTYPDACLVLANARGRFKSEIQKMLKELPDGSFREILFEEDISALYHAFDVFLHVPVDGDCEAFGQIYVEALASGIPSVFTISGIAHDFIEHEKNALVVPWQDSNSIYEAMKRLLNDEALRNDLKINGQEDVKHLFTMEMMMSKLLPLYE